MNALRNSLQNYEQYLVEAVERSLKDAAIFVRLRANVRKDIVEWIEGNIDLTRDKTANLNTFVDLSYTPYGIDVVRSWQKRSVRTIHVMAPPQTGKSCVSWMWPSLWAMCNDPGPMLTVYQNARIAADTNVLRIEPLMEGIPKLAEELASPKSKNREQYRFSFMYWNFIGSGSPITSIPFRYVIADEEEYWVMGNDADRKDAEDADRMFVSNVTALADRVNTFPNSYKIVHCCTPQMWGGPIHEGWLESSRGSWHMACLQCGGRHPSHVVHEKDSGLQWDVDDKGVVVPDSVCFVCGHCGHEHSETDRYELNNPDNGAGYVHEVLQLVDTQPGFQWGKLAAPFTPWRELAAAHVKAKNNNSLRIKMHYCNTVKGLPFKCQSVSEQLAEGMTDHCREIIDYDELDEIYWAADTQDKGWYWVAAGFDTHENMHVLGYDYVETELELGDAWAMKWDGRAHTVGCIDEGGHKDRPKVVKRFVAKRTGLLTYKGDWRVRQTVDRFWKTSHVQVDGGVHKHKRMLAVAKHYQAELIFRLHMNDDPSNHYVYLPDDVDERFVKQLCAMRPDQRTRHGDQPENWTNAGRADHYFDCLKEILVLRDARIWQRAKRKKKTHTKARN